MNSLQIVPKTSGLEPGQVYIEELWGSASQNLCAHRFPKELVKMQILTQ